MGVYLAAFAGGHSQQLTRPMGVRVRLTSLSTSSSSPSCHTMVENFSEPPASASGGSHRPSSTRPATSVPLRPPCGQRGRMRFPNSGALLSDPAGGTDGRRLEAASLSLSVGGSQPLCSVPFPPEPPAYLQLGSAVARTNVVRLGRQRSPCTLCDIRANSAH